MNNVNYIKPDHYIKFANAVDRTFQDRKKRLLKGKNDFFSFVLLQKKVTNPPAGRKKLRSVLSKG